MLRCVLFVSPNPRFPRVLNRILFTLCLAMIGFMILFMGALNTFASMQQDMQYDHSSPYTQLQVSHDQFVRNSSGVYVTDYRDGYRP